MPLVDFGPCRYCPNPVEAYGLCRNCRKTPRRLRRQVIGPPRHIHTCDTDYMTVPLGECCERCKEEENAVPHNRLVVAYSGSMGNPLAETTSQ